MDVRSFDQKFSEFKTERLILNITMIRDISYYFTILKCFYVLVWKNHTWPGLRVGSSTNPITRNNSSPWMSCKMKWTFFTFFNCPVYTGKRLILRNVSIVPVFTSIFLVDWTYLILTKIYSSECRGYVTTSIYI